ncbi:MAG: hypothetical protein ACUVX9_11170 [Anaerolineae bacterium]
MSFRVSAIVSLVMAALSWLGLGYVILTFWPDTMGRMFFLVLLLLAMTFTSAPLLLAIHARLMQDVSQAPRRLTAAWREAAFVGLLVAFCAWLRMIRVLNWVNALLLLAVLALTEVLLLARE